MIWPTSSILPFMPGDFPFSTDPKSGGSTFEVRATLRTGLGEVEIAVRPGIPMRPQLGQTSKKGAK